MSKEDINLPKTSFSMKANLPNKEPEILKIWQKLNLYKMEIEHTALAIRCYYEGVEGLADQIELHYLEEINPGYFWLFPAGAGKANIGLGLSKKNIKEQKPIERIILLSTTKTMNLFFTLTGKQIV